MDKRRESWEEEGKEDENLFPVFSERSQQDMSAIVSALTQVMGGNNNTQMHEASSIHNITQQSQLPQQDQGIINCFVVYILTHLYYILLCTNIH
jgi:hypothetical protein